METLTLFNGTEKLDFTGSVWRTEDGGFVTSSLKVAEYFGKPHKDVLEVIREKRSAENSANLWFFDSTYKDTYGRDQKQVLMNQSGFMFIAMGFTGAKADQIKIGYINEFERMRAMIQNNQIDFTNLDNVRQMLVALDKTLEENQKLKIELKENAPLTEIGRVFSEENGGMKIADVAKEAGIKNITRDYLLAVLVAEGVAKKDSRGYIKLYKKHSKDFVDARLYQKEKHTGVGNKTYLKTTVLGTGWLIDLAKEYYANGFRIEKHQKKQK